MFKRLVVYLYNYRNGEREENCGYAKITMYQGECRMELKVTNVPWPDGEKRLYFYQEKDGEFEKKEVMRGDMKSGELNLKHVCRCDRMVEGMSVGDVRGLLLYDGHDIMKVICGALRGEETEIHKLLQKSDNSVYEYDEECLKDKEQCSKEEVKEEGELREQEIRMETWQERLFQTFPKTEICINGETTVGIKLKPHDMVWFPSRYWRLASNKFLLNGYYQYRYLLFFRGIGECEGNYYIGTPGSFSVNDAITAKKFGFTDFFQVNKGWKQELKFGEKEDSKFGFWCHQT